MSASAPLVLSELELVAGHAGAQGVDPTTFVGVLNLRAPGIESATLVSCHADGEMCNEAPQIHEQPTALLGVPRLRLSRTSFPGKGRGCSEGEREEEQDGCFAKISHDQFLSGRRMTCSLHGRRAKPLRAYGA